MENFEFFEPKKIFTTDPEKKSPEKSAQVENKASVCFFCVFISASDTFISPHSLFLLKFF